MDLLCRIISLENAANFPFFCRNLSEALHRSRTAMEETADQLRLSLTLPIVNVI